MVEAGGFNILLPLHHVSHFHTCLFIYSKQSRLLLHLQDGIASLEPVHFRMEGRGKEGQDPKTGLKMEKKKKLQALWTNTNNIAIHQTVIVLAPSQLFQKTHFLFSPRSIFSSLDRGGLSISACEKIAFCFLSFPLLHLSLYPSLLTSPAGHAFQPNQPLRCLILR